MKKFRHAPYCIEFSMQHYHFNEHLSRYGKVSNDKNSLYHYHQAPRKYYNSSFYDISYFIFYSIIFNIKLIVKLLIFKY